MLKNKELKLLIDVVIEANNKKFEEAVADLIMFGIYNISIEDVKFIYNNNRLRKKHLSKGSASECRKKKRDKKFKDKIVKCYVLRPKKDYYGNIISNKQVIKT